MPLCSRANILPVRPKPRLDFVDNEENAVLVADAAQLAQELEGRDIEASLALHRLDHHRGDAGRLHVRLEEELQRLERVLRFDAVETVRIGDVVDVARKGPETLLVRIDLAGERHGHKGAAMEAAGKGDHRRALGRGARDLDRILDRLGTRW